MLLMNVSTTKQSLHNMHMNPTSYPYLKFPHQDVSDAA